MDLVRIRYMPRRDEEEELNGGDVVALVGDADGVQKVSRSAHGVERAEWRVVSTNPQIAGNVPEPGEEHTAVPIVFSGQVFTFQTTDDTYSFT